MDIVDRLFKGSVFNTANNLNRWSGMNHIKSENVAQHSYMVSVITLCLCEEIFSQLSKNCLYKAQMIQGCLSYAILHDFDESFTGDISHSVKHNDMNGESIKKLLQDYAHKVMREEFSDNSFSSKMILNYCLNNHQLHEPILKIVKLADWISMYIYCKSEVRMGNKNFEQVVEYCFDNIKKSCRYLHLCLIANENVAIGNFDYTILNKILRYEY